MKRLLILAVTLAVAAGVVAPVSPVAAQGGSCSVSGDPASGFEVSWSGFATSEVVIRRTVTFGNGSVSGPHHRDRVLVGATPYSDGPAPNGGVSALYEVQGHDGVSTVGDPVDCSESTPAAGECTVSGDPASGFEVSWSGFATSEVVIRRTITFGDGSVSGPHHRDRVLVGATPYSDGPAPNGGVSAVYEVQGHDGATIVGDPVDCIEAGSVVESTHVWPSSVSAGVELWWGWAAADGTVPAETRVSRDGSVLGVVDEAQAQEFTDGGLVGTGSYLLEALDDAGSVVASSSLTVTAGVEGSCRWAPLAPGIATVLWDNPPVGVDLYVDQDRSLAPFSAEAGLTFTLDYEHEAGHEYSVAAFDWAGNEAWVEACTQTTLADAVGDLQAAGLPFLDSGEPGSDRPEGPVTRVSNPVGNVFPDDPVDAPDLCAAGGGMAMYVADSPNGTWRYATITVPPGATLMADGFNAKYASRQGDWNIHVGVYDLLADGSRGASLGASSDLRPGYYEFVYPDYRGGIGPGDHEAFVDGRYFTNTGSEGREVLVALRMDAQNTSTEGNPHSRIENIRFEFPDGTIVDPCRPPEVIDCEAQGGNLYLDEPIVHGDEHYGRGCYYFDNCHTDGQSLAGLRRWSCQNQDLLASILAGGAAVVLVGGVLVIGGGPVAVGLAIGAVTGFYLCDESGNGGLVPPNSFGDIDARCFATEVAIGGLSGGLGGFVSGRLVSSGASLIRTAVITCTYGAAEAAGTYTIATVVQGDNPDLTPTTINAALGCTTSGIATGFEARRFIDAPNGIPPAVYTPSRLEQLATQHITDSGETVLGKYSAGYIQVAIERNASYFDLGDEWNRMLQIDPDLPWAVNRSFLDQIAARGDRVTLVLLPNTPPDGYLQNEIDYLVDFHDYVQVGSTRLSPPPD